MALTIVNLLKRVLDTVGFQGNKLLLIRCSYFLSEYTGSRGRGYVTFTFSKHNHFGFSNKYRFWDFFQKHSLKYHFSIEVTFMIRGYTKVNRLSMILRAINKR